MGSKPSWCILLIGLNAPISGIILLSVATPGDLNKKNSVNRALLRQIECPWIDFTKTSSTFQACLSFLCVCLSKMLKLSVLQFPICKIRLASVLLTINKNAVKIYEKCNGAVASKRQQGINKYFPIES